MSKLCQIIISEAFEQTQLPNGSTINKVIQPILMFKLPFVPSTLTFQITVITTGYKLDKGLWFGYSITDADDKDVFIQPKQSIPAIAQNFDNFNFNIEARNIQLMKPGSYFVKVFLDEDVVTQEFIVMADKVYDYSGQ